MPLVGEQGGPTSLANPAALGISHVKLVKMTYWRFYNSADSDEKKSGKLKLNSSLLHWVTFGIIHQVTSVLFVLSFAVNSLFHLPVL